MGMHHQHHQHHELLLGRPLPQSSPFVHFSTSSSWTDESSSSSRDDDGVAGTTATTIPRTPDDKHGTEQEQVNTNTIQPPSTFVVFPFEYHELVDIQIETLTNRGWGIGRVDLSNRLPPENLHQRPKERPSKVEHRTESREDAATDEEDDSFLLDDNVDADEDVDSKSTTARLLTKWVVMVPNVIPGERVRVRIFRNFRNYSEGDLVEVLTASIDRVIPVCPVASECGGCQLQHMSIESQRRWKAASVRDSLRQYGILNNNVNINQGVLVSPTIGTPEFWGYRSKLTPHYQAPEKRRRKSRGQPESTAVAQNIKAIGFQRQTNRSIIDVAQCPIATQAVNDKYAQVRTELLSQPSTRTKGATLLFRQANVQKNAAHDDDGLKTTDKDDDQLNPDYVCTNHQEYLTTRVRGLDFTYQAGNFFQNNYYVLPLMVDHVVRHASSATQSPENCGMTHLVDCYCGSGLFALSAAARFETVVGIEINAKAVEEATANALRNNIANCQFRAAAAEAIFADISHFPKRTTAVVLDPPRKGCSMDFLTQLNDFAPQRIVYMSCDPTTQARDAQYLVGTGHYAITSVQPFDLFPQTRHIECLIVFDRQSVDAVVVDAV